jgi:hypothetical protein
MEKQSKYKLLVPMLLSTVGLAQHSERAEEP